MQSTITELTGELVVVRCWCGIQHAVPESLRNEQVRQFNDGKRPMGIHCPLGHSHVPSGESASARLKRQLEAKDNAIAYERSRHDQTKAELRDTENRRRAEKAAKTRLKNRIAKGVCPCCNRHFANVHRHIQSQHPEFVLPAPTESEGE